MRDNMPDSARSIGVNTFAWLTPNVSKLKLHVNRFLKHLAADRNLSRPAIHGVLPPLVVVAGAVACGIWLNSTAAGLLACMLLFLAVSIVKSLERIASTLGSQPFVASPANWRGSGTDGTNEQKIYISTKAVEHLRPWVEDESSLTEESAKAYCSVLLDTLAILNPRLAGNTRTGGSSF